MPILTNLVGGLLTEAPDVPDFIPIDVQEEQQRAIAGNISALPEIRTLGGATQGFLLDQIQTGMEKLFPGTSEIVAKAGQQIQSGLKGELPRDVQDLIARRAAERGISSGTGGSQLARFGELATLGLTSLERITQTLDAAMRWVNTARASTPVFDPSSFFISPQFQAQFAQSERDRAFGTAFTQNQINAAHSFRTILGQSLIQGGNELAALVRGQGAPSGGTSEAEAGEGNAFLSGVLRLLTI